MIVAHEPIPYVLEDPVAEADHSLHPVDSTYHRCCHSIGKHRRDCAEQGDVRLLAYLRRGVVTLQFSDGGQPFQMTRAEAAALGEHLMVLAGRAVAR
ncbi:hypothetical protein [Mycolicibacter minnesotensis]